MRRMQLAAFAALVSLGTSAAFAQEAPPRLHTLYRAAVGARTNPEGLLGTFAFQVRYRLYESESLALKDNFVAAGPIGLVSPALVRGGIGLELQPLSVLQLSASFEGTRLFGNFNHLQSFQSPNADSSDRRLIELSQSAEGSRSYSSSGTLLTLGAILQLKVGPIAARTHARLMRFDLQLRDGDRVFYEPIMDVVVPNGGWTATQDTDLVYLRGRLALGLRYTSTAGIFRAGDFPTGEEDLGLNPTLHAVGPFAAWTFYDRPDRLFNAPTLVLMSQWYLSHRYRAGAESSRVFPTLGLGFLFGGMPSQRSGS